MNNAGATKAAALQALASHYLPKGGRVDVAAAGIVVAIILAMILPMPSWLLDVLIAFSISVAALMVVMVLQIRESTHLSAFPTMLLLTTLLRISISIASTRLILLEGAAGYIIEAFGEVVVGGNLVVGLVVFLILTAVQFLVITKGSERVAEVGARFTLDAMPGKQLAIDMELKSGNITADQARARRLALARDSQFFGAMDGAMKFVKGDAIAGILIILINLVGGMTVGVAQRGLPAGEAMRVYSILSIGDGLVAQIPALLLSVSAGLLITRVVDGGTDEGPRAVGRELALQLMAYPRAWITAGGAMLLFGLVPGMPTAVFLVFAAAAIGVGTRRILATERAEREDRWQREGVVPEIREFSPVRAFTVRVGAKIGDAAAGQRFANLAREVRNDLTVRYGMSLPAVEIDTGAALDDADVEFCCDEIRAYATRLRDPECAVVCESVRLAELAIVPIAEEANPQLPGRLRYWVSAADAQTLRTHGLAVEEFWPHARARLFSLLAARGPRHFSLEQAAKLMKWIAATYPEMAKELERVLPTSRMADVLQRLLAERVSIRNVYTIAQALIEWAARERDPVVLCECVRAALSREICNACAHGNELHAFVLDADYENELRGAIRQTAFGDVLDLDHEAVEAVLDQFALQLDGRAMPCTPVILCRQDVRPQVRAMFRDRFEDIAVLSLSEVTQEFKVQLHGVIQP